MNKIYNDEDIEKILNGLKERENARNMFLEVAKTISEGDDLEIITTAVTDYDFVTEDFTKYDSDVLEQFLQCFERYKEVGFSYYLELLRRTGKTNMYGAVPYLKKEFNIEHDEARDILHNWMDNYNESDYKEEYLVTGTLSFIEFMEEGV